MFKVFSVFLFVIGLSASSSAQGYGYYQPIAYGSDNQVYGGYNLPPVINYNTHGGAPAQNYVPMQNNGGYGGPSYVPVQNNYAPYNAPPTQNYDSYGPPGPNYNNYGSNGNNQISAPSGNQKKQRYQTYSGDQQYGTYGTHGMQNDVNQFKPWGYLNEEKFTLPGEWPKIDPVCMGQQQSPINIDAELTRYDPKLKPIVIKRSNMVPAGAEDGPEWFDDGTKEVWSAKNTGDTLYLTPLNKAFKMQLSPEKETFRLLQMHFHWRGSEHTFNGNKYAAEMHLVHQSTKNPEQLAVLGFFIQLDKVDNEALKPLIDVVRRIERYNTTTEVEPFRLRNILPMRVDNYFRYSGSLTTPGCDEIVNWVVVESPVIKMSEDQLVQLQTLQDANGYPILTNARPVQEIFEREVTRSFRTLNKPASPTRPPMGKRGKKNNGKLLRHRRR